MYRGSLVVRVVDEIVEVTTITTVADVADNLDGTYFNLFSALDATKYYVWFRTPEIAEISDVVCRADSTDDLDGTYFILFSAKDATKYHVWYNTSGGGATDPAPGGSTPIEVAIDTDETANGVATKTATAINALGDFAASPSTATVTITNAAVGATTNVADFDTTHVSFTVTTAGRTQAADPAPPASTGIMVSIAQGATAIAVADAAETAINGIADFTAPTDGDDDIEITNVNNGVTTDASDFDTSFTPFVIDTQGSGGDVTIGQPIKLHGYVIREAAAEVTLNIWLNDKSGNPVWDDAAVSGDLGKPVDFTTPIQIGVDGDIVIFEVIGNGGHAYVRYD